MSDNEVTGPGYRLILGNCLDVMPTLDAGSVDAVITDPPYGVDFKSSAWDESIPDWIGIARSISPIVVFTTAPTTLWSYPRPDWVACWYRTAAQSRNAMGGFNHWTPVLVYGNAKFTVGTFYTHGMVTAMANKGIEHPSPKDIKMVCWLIENSSRPGDTILDPFMGSGTTGVACRQLGRNFIGIELDANYFEIATKRCADAAAQPRLPFLDVEAEAPKPTQSKMFE